MSWQNIILRTKPANLGEGLQRVVNRYGEKGAKLALHTPGECFYSNGVGISNFSLGADRRIQVHQNGEWCHIRDYIDGGSTGVFDSRKMTGNGDYYINKYIRHKDKELNGYSWCAGRGASCMEAKIKGFFIKNVLNPIASVFKN